MMQSHFNDLKNNLKESDIDSIVRLVGNRCHYKTKARLSTILTYWPSGIEDCGIMRRLTKENGTWAYCAGQDYQAEIKTVRNVILGKV
jgi:hypothetical protein